MYKVNPATKFFCAFFFLIEFILPFLKNFLNIKSLLISLTHISIDRYF